MLSTLSPALRATRPKQWIKNLAVFVGPFSSGFFFNDGVILRTLITSVGFVLVSGATYIMNDLSDLESDKLHPVKKFRPIASGSLSPFVARILMITLLFSGFLLLYFVNASVLVIGVTYYVINIFYTHGLKDLYVFEMLAVALGFVLRGLAGVYAIPDVPNVWFILLALFGSLLLVAGKRSGEIQVHENAIEMRKSLSMYSTGYLQFVRDFSAAGLITAYGLMTFEKSASYSEVGRMFTQISLLPFLAVIMLLVYKIDKGQGEDPSDFVVRDPALFSLVVLWLCCFGFGVYL